MGGGGGLRKCLCFGYYLKMEAFLSELLTGHIYSIKSCIKKKKIIFATVPKLSIGFNMHG